MSIIPVCNSDFAEYFQCIDSEGIVLLDKDDALQAWAKYIDDEAYSYFKLSDNNWLVSSKPEVIGNWLQAFNDSKDATIEEVLAHSIKWSETNTILFCISRHFAIQATWQLFKRHWRCFMECDDDCPIIINTMNHNCAILFYPIGTAVKIEKA